MKKLLTISGALIFMLLIAVGCSKDDSTSNPNLPGHTIHITNSGFNSDSVQVATGEFVTWINDDNTAHTVTADDGSFDSGDITPGSSYKLQFNTIGIFYYHCKNHSTMTGVIRVLGR